MMEPDPLSALLREAEAPEPSPALDARVRAAYRRRLRPSPWRRFWSARVTIPVPALATAALIVAAILLQFRPAPVPKVERLVFEDGFVTRLDATGFQPLTNGAARVVTIGDFQQ